MKKSQEPASGKWMYEIRVEGELGKEWSSWFDGLTVENQIDRKTGDRISVISGIIPDQSALHGLLIKIRDLNLPILSCVRKG